MLRYINLNQNDKIRSAGLTKIGASFAIRLFIARPNLDKVPEINLTYEELVIVLGYGLRSISFPLVPKQRTIRVNLLNNILFKPDRRLVPIIGRFVKLVKAEYISDMGANFDILY